MAFINYLVDSYRTYAASAMAAPSCARSILGAGLPFAARPMFEGLGIWGACAVLGCLAVGMCAIPFVFIRFGDVIRAKSEFCRPLKEDEEGVEKGEEMASSASSLSFVV